MTMSKQRKIRSQLAEVPLLGKFAGAVGGYQAHLAAYPAENWPAEGAKFVASLGLTPNPYTTQARARARPSQAARRSSDMRS